MLFLTSILKGRHPEAILIYNFSICAPITLIKVVLCLTCKYYRPIYLILQAILQSGTPRQCQVWAAGSKEHTAEPGVAIELHTQQGIFCISVPNGI